MDKERNGNQMRSSNPVLKNLPQAQQQGYGYGSNEHTPYGGVQTEAGQAPQVSQDSQRPMTVDDIVSKTGITLAVIVAFAAVNFALCMGVNQGIGMILTFVGGIAAFITVLVHSFSKSFGSPTVTLLYAAFEGLFVGGFSFLIGGTAGELIFQAILGTIGVFIGMLFVYRTGAIRVTPRFNRALTGMIFGVAILALGNFLLAMFTGINPLRGDGVMAIIFSLVCIVIASLSFLQDFDLADKLVRSGAPAKEAWGVALGLAVTLIWLYTEILRFLSIFNDD